MSTTTVSAVTDADFEVRVLQAGHPVLVDFWASWCAPCRMIYPIVQDLAAELGERITVLKMDIDANPEVPNRFGVMSIPTLIIFKDGEAAERMVGYRSNIKADLKQKLEALL